jgi:hypothetical protein
MYIVGVIAIIFIVSSILSVLTEMIVNEVENGELWMLGIFIILGVLFMAN